jgi:hypothetical protein
MANGDITISPKVKELKEQCALLRNELATLLADRDHLTGTVGPNLVAIYATKIGVKEYEALSLDVEVRRLKSTIEKIQAIENQDKKPNLEQIEAAVETELEEWKAKVDKMLEDIKAGQDRLNNQMSDEDSTELQKLYHKLAKKLHPDLNPDLTDEQKQLWTRVQIAYAMCNLEEMKALILLVDDMPDEIKVPNQLEQLEKLRDSLKRKVRSLLSKIAEIKRNVPYSLASKLNDPTWVQEQIDVCEKRIAVFAAQKHNLEEWLIVWGRQHE